MDHRGGNEKTPLHEATLKRSLCVFWGSLEFKCGSDIESGPATETVELKPTADLRAH